MNTNAIALTKIDTMPFKAITSHARFVLATKIGFFVIAIILVGLLVVLPLTHPAEKQIKLTYNPQHTEAPPATVMSKPRFQGIDAKNQPYNITAEQADQPSFDKVVLTKPTADITLQDGRWLSLLANQAVFIPSEKKLSLTGAVNIFTDNGFELRTPSAFVNLVNGTASGNEPIEIQGMPGTLTAKGFTLTNQGNNIVFTGPVHMIIYPAKK
jgi:lipopolysaccharide export system protein LptC